MLFVQKRTLEVGDDIRRMTVDRPQAGALDGN
jgi:hypothetical protein